ncbi:hypothetical protein O6H91_17G062700 [Diphasiastrum complanatum]|uniref:Uncharacterized protein n=1 Tax=Diphasiastrum complanatum TaxID=34168 RepID=A0ACC2B7J8_DIPCM|nr:hypothetical protein O6H91_Y064700 [Diphasiastrum complanatum]KAJ7525713.1 hypothetical protein O6H91_17G062700 [Diphasiastrum complanatum]
MVRMSNLVLASGLGIFAAAGLAFPFFLRVGQTKPIVDSSKPLPPQAVVRGPYVNTGSKDVGPDPNRSLGPKI